MSNYCLIRFHANWCMPCKAMAETLSKVLPEFTNIKLTEIDIDDDVEKSREFKIRSIPTLILIKDGEEVDRFVGNQGIDQLRKFLTR